MWLTSSAGCGVVSGQNKRGDYSAWGFESSAGTFAVEMGPWTMAMQEGNMRPTCTVVDEVGNVLLSRLGV